MHLTTRNVNSAFRELVSLFNSGVHPGLDRMGGTQVPVVTRPSRNGNVLVIDEPVTITYTHPRERVLFNAARDANPFFHLYESLWMLAGRNDVAPPAYYAKQMLEYSDDGKVLNGAYGYRWRQARTVSHIHDVYCDERDGGGITGPGNQTVRANLRFTDQLDFLVAHLKADPTSRRAVLQMWNVEDDLLNIGIKSAQGTHNLMEPSKDTCCNLSVMFSLRTTKGFTDTSEPGEYEYDPSTGQYEPQGVYYPGKIYLDMTVTNRSNDLVWGLLGANYVHFTVLQEYVAARLGAGVGRYHHFTNNLHAYDWNWKPDEWLNDPYPYHGYGRDPKYTDVEPVKTLVPLVKDPEAFERELPLFVDHFANPHDLGDRSPFQTWTEPFLETVAKPMLVAHAHHKVRAATTEAWADRIAADDWRLAAKGWLERRAK